MLDFSHKSLELALTDTSMSDGQVEEYLEFMKGLTAVLKKQNGGISGKFLSLLNE